MAEIGEPFNGTDMIDPRLPGRKLRFAGSSESCAFVLYFQGGFVPSAHLLIAQLDSGRVSKSAEFYVTTYVESIDDLKRLVPNGLHPVSSSASVPPNNALDQARGQ